MIQDCEEPIANGLINWVEKINSKIKQDTEEMWQWTTFEGRFFFLNLDCSKYPQMRTAISRRIANHQGVINFINNSK